MLSLSPRTATGSAWRVVNPDRRGEPVLAQAGRYRSNLGVGVGPGISKMRRCLLNWKMLDALLLRKHTSTSLIGCEDLPQVAPVAPAWRTEPSFTMIVGSEAICPEPWGDAETRPTIKDTTQLASAAGGRVPERVQAAGGCSFSA